MKKTFLIAALFIGVLLCAGGYSDADYRTSLGRTAPALCLSQADSLVSIDCLRGDYVLLNFWSSTDAPSREAVNLYTAWQRRHPVSDLKIVSVNFDESAALFREIVKRDSLVAAEQYHASGDTARAIIDNYGLDRGFGSVLIDPKGHIVAHNPTEGELDRMFATTPDPRRSTP